ncbi:uncharacterized protein LOC115415965 isoform X2 [Sphaeramia orbicularis]|uniref:uncharacterized protein LOC115415965 isoform X2 n=1 Tax=Sphaeramia orbicularis TaxID=375764 RepID=UPI00117FAD49|nr:uncharacterized protein LOC115415965 isoform X2 [Sphaeramia orbicularis]
MAEQEGTGFGPRELERHLHGLSSRYSGDQLRADSKAFCADFCKLVEDHASHWKLPLPQLRILEVALQYFSRASAFFTSNCDHVLHTLSSLALSVSELLLFFDQTDFNQEPLKHFTITFQECHSALAKHQNVHLHQVERWVQGGGPWASHAFQAILRESSLPQKEVEECIGCELPVFLELRVRYLLSCERLPEALALAKCCAQHPTAGQHLFFLQVYLTWLYKTSQHERLHKEVCDFNGEDAVHIICSLECEEKDELLLALNRAFLSQQLRRGDMYYLCDLVSIWSKLHSRLKTSKQTLLKECHQLMLSATNVNSIFPFIRIILAELGEGGVQFCVELCANALKSCLLCDAVTKSLIYKTIASLLPNDLEVCRACALLVFFLERTVDAYKMVYLLYMHPDQEYHVDCSPIGNHIRFETLQILKKDLYFDPEFWNLIALRTNCLKLMSEKVVSAALEEIMEEKWVPDYCKEPSLRSRKSSCQKGTKGLQQAAAKKRHHKDDRVYQGDRADAASKRVKVGPGRPRLNTDPSVKRRASQGSRPAKEAPSEPLRRSFWQLDRIHDNIAGYSEQRRTTRLSEKNPPKRRIRKPRWLLEDSGTLENNAPLKAKRHSLKHQTSVIKRSEMVQVKNNTKHKALLNSHLKTRENHNNNNNKPQKGTSADGLTSTCPPQVVLELSLPDNELMGTFTEETCNRHRGYPQMLFYRPTVKIPASSQPLKPVHRKEVILRARDPSMFVQLLHCYARRPKGKGTSTNNQGSVSTITRSSVHGSPPKHEKPSVEMKVMISSQSDVTDNVPEAQREEVVSYSITSDRDLCENFAAVKTPTAAENEAAEAPVLDRVPEAESKEEVLETKASVRVLSEGSVEMKVTVASPSPAATKLPPPPVLERVSKPQTADHVLKSTTLSRDTSTSDNIPDAAENMLSKSQDSAPVGGELLLNGEHKHDANLPSSNSEKGRHVLTQGVKHSPDKGTNSEGNRVSLCEVSAMKATESDNLNDMSALTLVTEMVTEITRDLENHKDPAPEDSASKQSVVCNSKPNVPPKVQSTSSCSQQQLSAQEESEDAEDDGSEYGDHVETEESKLLYTCTFCHKVFKGSRVVAHAMFHYRKDECMFCGVMFKDDLLAMMHLSDHIEKLKKLKETTRNKSQESHTSKSKDMSKHKTSAKTKTTNVSSGHRNSERLKKSTEVPKTKTVSESSPPKSRKLRCNDRLVRTPLLQTKEQNKSKCLKMKDPVHKVNGHIDKKKDGHKTKQETLALKAKLRTQLHQQDISDRRTSGRDKTENLDPGTSTSTQVKKEPVSSTEDKIKGTESQPLKTTANQNKQLADKNHVELQEKLCCPVDGCTWFTDMLKNRVALLYHALEDHHGDDKPLELAFRVGNGKCSICTRVLYSFEHFQHHVERHRLTPRHPCLHLGCTARFKSGMEMRRHARRHSPLQAVCCLPGCPQLFICLWALNLHEKDHYSSKSTKSVPNVQSGDKHKNPEFEKKTECHKPKSAVADLAVKKKKSVKAKRKLRCQTPPNSSVVKQVKAPLLATDRTSVLKEQNETKEAPILKNLPNSKAPPQSAASYQRLRQTLRKRQETRKTNLAPPRTYKIVSSISKPSAKVKLTLKKRQAKVNAQRPARRRAPLESAKTTVENTRKNEVIKKKSVLKEDQKMSPPKATQASVVNKFEEEVGTRLSSHETMATRAELKQIKTSHVKHKTQKSVPTGMCGRQSLSTSVTNKTHKLKAVKGNKMHISKKHTASKHKKEGPTERKQDKVTNSKVPTQTVKNKRPQKKANNQAALKKSEKLKSAVEEVEEPAETVAHTSAAAHEEDEHFHKESATPSGVERVEDAATVEPSAASDEEKVKSEPMGSPQTHPDVYAPVFTTNTTSGEEEQTSATELKSKKSQVAKKSAMEKELPTAPSHSVKAKKKHRVRKTKDKNTETKRQKKTGKTRAAKAVKKVEAKASQSSSSEGGEKVKEETLDADGSSTSMTANASDPVTCRPLTSEENQSSSTAEGQEAKVARSSSKATGKSKVNQRHGDTKTVKRKCPSADKGILRSSKTKVQRVTKVNPEAVQCPEGKEEGKCPLGGPSGPGYSIMVNGQLTSEDKSAALKDAFAQFRKRPYMRLPPTAYLDEKYITMPKRRKEMSMFPESQKSPPLEQASAAASLQRQRCVNCFTTFNTAEELQSHLQLQKCTNLFGFDSDDEGEKSVST